MNKHNKIKKDSKLIRITPPSYRACHWTEVTQQQQNCLQIIHLCNTIDSPVQDDAALWGLESRASKVLPSKRRTQVAETILSPQKTFQPEEELDGVCCAVQGFAKEAPGGGDRGISPPWPWAWPAECRAQWGNSAAEEVGWLQTQTRQQTGACSKKKLSTNRGHAFKGSTVSFLAFFLRFWAFLSRLWAEEWQVLGLLSYSPL